MFSRTPSCNVVAGHGCFELTFKLKEIVSMHYNFKIDLLRDQKTPGAVKRVLMMVFLRLGNPIDVLYFFCGNGEFQDHRVTAVVIVRSIVRKEIRTRPIKWRDKASCRPVVASNNDLFAARLVIKYLCLLMPPLKVIERDFGVMTRSRFLINKNEVQKNN